MKPALVRLAELIRGARSVVALTGAGISVPSGIPDFRSPGTGLWENVDPTAVAHIDVFRGDPVRFWGFYGQRFASLDQYVGDRLWRWLMKKHGSLHRKRSTIRRLPTDRRMNGSSRNGREVFAMPRFVILEHDHPHLHWDLMLEADGSLHAWRLACVPVVGSDHAGVFERVLHRAPTAAEPRLGS